MASRQAIRQRLFTRLPYEALDGRRDLTPRRRGLLQFALALRSCWTCTAFLFCGSAQRGLMTGIEMKQKIAPYIKELQDRKIIALNAGMTVIRLLPPLVITYQQLDYLIKMLKEVLVGELEPVGA